MRFITKKTIELSPAEKQGLVDLFNEVFEKHRSVEEFEHQFLNNCEGYSFHTYAEENGVIVASNTMIPSLYRVGDEIRSFTNSVDTMISKPYRGLENFYDMIRESFGYCSRLGYDAVYGFPNDNSYQLFTQLKFMKDVGKLDTYCLPYRIGGIKKGLGWLNWATMAASRLWIWCSSLFASSKAASFAIEKEAGSYNATRYKRSDGKYSVVKDLFAYKVMKFEGIRTAFIIDVFDKSPANFVKSIKYLMLNERNNFDLVLYVGHLPFVSHGMIRFPRKYEPKHFNFTGAIFSKDKIDRALFYHLDSWDINLSNYDVI